MKVLASFLFLCFLGFVFSFPTQSDVDCKEGCHPIIAGKVNVHLVPHSHDDVGWLKNVEEYYYGDNNGIQVASVKNIISSTVEALQKNPERRFIQVETAFFSKWWSEQTNKTRDSVIQMVNNGQLEIINGAWSMNDEAAANYHSIIDQFTWGFKAISDTLGKCGRPKIGWQIDPFGHSREHASLLTQLGFEGLIIGRLDYRDKEKRIEDKNLDFIWKTSTNLENSNLFTSMFPDFYTPVNGFCFDSLCSDRISTTNIDYKVEQFSGIMDKYAQYYNTPNILIPMGGDFQFQQAEVNYDNLDSLIKGFKDHEKYNVIYSTPSCYIKAVNAEVSKKNIKLNEKSDDFFPYASASHRFWTGYFTSRPTSKRFERVGNNILQGAKQLATLSRINNKSVDKSIHYLREALGIMQHHDAITGTEKQAVANDYAKLLSNGTDDAVKSMGVVIGDLLKIDPESKLDLKFKACLLANVSICTTTSTKNKFLVAIQNPLSREVNHYVHLPVDGVNFKITGPDGEEIYDVFDTIHSFDFVKEPTKPSTKELVFKATNLPPLGLKLYYVEKLEGPSINYKPFKEVTTITNYGTSENSLDVDATTGKLTSVTIKGKKAELTQEFKYYSGCNTYLQTSGAYVFKPVEETPNSFPGTIQLKAASGQLVDQVHQVVSDGISQIIRVYKDPSEAFIEFDWLVGDLKVEKYGTEIITKFTIKDIDNKGVFFTDSNGRQQIRRELNKRSDYSYDPTEEPVSSNYYPITSKIVIKDETKNLEVAVLNDRSQGGSSLKAGTIELMVHRKLVRDDGFGVNEVLEEKQYGKGLYVRGQHYLTFGPATQSGDISTAAFERDLAHRKLLAPLVLLGDATTSNLDSVEKVKKLLKLQFNALTVALPLNVQILTLEPWSNSYLLRLEHILEKDEDAELSKPVTIQLKDLFTTFNITKIQETTLGANELMEDFVKEKKMVWNGVEYKVEAGEALGELEFVLNPMQIRTFIFLTDKNNDGDDNYNDRFNPGNKSNRCLQSTVLIIFAMTLSRVFNVMFLVK